MFADKKLSNPSEFYHLEPGLCPSFTDIVEAMNTLIQKRHYHNESCNTVGVSRRTQKNEIWLTDEGSGLAFYSMEKGLILRSNAGNEFGKKLREKRPHKPFAYYIVGIHFLILHTDLIGYKTVDDTRTLLLRCFLFVSKLKYGDFLTTGQYLNYQTFSNLQFIRLLKNSFHSIHIDFRDTNVIKTPFVFTGITRLVLMFKKDSNIHF